MDDIERIFCNFTFKDDFRTKTKQEFEDWFESLGQIAYGPNFQVIRAHGRLGDKKQMLAFRAKAQSSKYMHLSLLI